MDFDAVCKSLASVELGAVADAEGVVWGQIKGYPHWPVRRPGGGGARTAVVGRQAWRAATHHCFS